MDAENPNPESWEDVANRVVSEEITAGYANSLMNAYKAYRSAGFSEQQSWELTLAEHCSRLEFNGQIAMHQMYSNPDEG